MRFPIRSETEAFYFALATAALVGVGVVVGVLASALVGLIAFLALALLALVAYLGSTDDQRRQPLREAVHAPHRQGAVPDARHVLVIANEPLAGEELRQRIIGSGSDDRRVELDVLAPVLTSRTHLAYTDIDESMRQARDRLEQSLAWARSQGLLVHGSIGDSDPAASIEDELREFGADEVIVVTADGKADHWQEQDQLRRLRAELDVPVVHVATKRPAAQSAA